MLRSSRKKKSLTRERTSSENLQTDALGVFEKQKRSTTTEEQRALDSDDEPIESSVSDLTLRMAAVSDSTLSSSGRSTGSRGILILPNDTFDGLCSMLIHCSRTPRRVVAASRQERRGELHQAAALRLPVRGGRRTWLRSRGFRRRKTTPPRPGNAGLP